MVLAVQKVRPDLEIRNIQCLLVVRVLRRALRNPGDLRVLTGLMVLYILAVRLLPEVPVSRPALVDRGDLQVRDCWTPGREDPVILEDRRVQMVRLDQVVQMTQEVRKHLEVRRVRKVLEVLGCRPVLEDLADLVSLECPVRLHCRWIPEVPVLQALRCYQAVRTVH